MKKYDNFNFKAGLVITALIVLIAVTGCFVTPYPSTQMDNAMRFAPPGAAHIMGCDNYGRDIFSRVMEGIRNTLFIALGTVAIGTVFGVILGAVCGYFGGTIDLVLMRINDVMFSFPSILLALVIVSILGTGSFNVVIALGIAFVPSFARIVRAEYKKNIALDYVQSAALFGAGHMRIIFVHILPNILPVLLSAVMIGFNNAVLAEAGLSYLGIGVQPPEASLGRMLSEAQSYMFTAPWYAIFPGLAIALMVLGFALVAEGISEDTVKGGFR
ncbi:MAG: ABC transporter permease [Lachnospiraceae bacterium]|nr:ABC transporter permease [Lachnospiraceae bacterium]